jgi:hypothetical protein
MSQEKRTSDEALQVALEAQRKIFVRGSNWDKQANHIVARNVLDSELGKFSDYLPVYTLDQQTRDRLLVHGRQDAAEALCHARSLMDEMHQLKRTLRGLNFSIVIFSAALLLWAWWKAGFIIGLG